MNHVAMKQTPPPPLDRPRGPRQTQTRLPNIAPSRRCRGAMLMVNGCLWHSALHEYPPPPTPPQPFFGQSSR